MLYSSSTLFWGHTLKKMIEALNYYELDGMEIWYEQMKFFNIDSDVILSTFSKNNKKKTVHASSWDLNLASINRGIKEQSLLEIKQSILFAKSIRAEDVTIHPGKCSAMKNLAPWHRKQMKDSLQQVDQWAQFYEMPVSIELMEPISKELYTESFHLNELIEGCSRWITTTFDTAHSCLVPTPVQTIQSLKKIGKIHLSDSTEEKYHVPINKGNIDWKSILPVIQRLNVPMILEGFDESPDHKVLQEHLNGLHVNGFLKNRYEVI